MSLRQEETSIHVSWDDTELFQYTYRPGDPQLESPRPYLHPVRTLAGELVTDCRPDDHPWHKGIAWSLPNVGTENFWGGPTYRRGDGYIQLENNGAIRHESFDVVKVTQDAAVVAERLSWVTQAGQLWFTERRRIEVTATPPAWTLTYEVTMHNVSGHPVSIGSPTTQGRDNAGYGGLFWRGPREFTGGRVITPDSEKGEGEAGGGDELMGWRGPWVAFSGPASTLVFRESPANAGFPSQWFVRSTPFACVCPAPFFAAERAIPAGAELALRYEIVVADGQPADLFSHNEPW
jgi:Methane oxygenase PmoA